MSVTDIAYHSAMGRWESNAQGRLEQAALELYVENGFDQTTVSQIAQRAGLTERTFFRHFADKREVLFSGAATLEGLFVSTIEGLPAAVTPIDAVVAALEAAGPVFDERGDAVRRRQRVIDANTELQERELIKMSALGSAITEALIRRGVAELAASLAAGVGIAVFRIAFERWIRQTGGPDFGPLVQESLVELNALFATDLT